MKVHNVHERRLIATPDRVGSLLASLGGTEDRLWPRDRWPPMRLDRPLGPGASGGHGPVRYRVAQYVPGQRVVFEFDRDAGLTRGFVGTHSFEVMPDGDAVLLRHTIEASCSVATWLRWLVLIRSLHDALLEDGLDRATRALGGQAPERPFSLWVRTLRWFAQRAFSDRGP